MALTDLQQELIRLLGAQKDELPSLESQVTNTRNSLTEHLRDSVAVNDSYGNSLLSVGTQDKVEDFTKYGFSNDSLNWLLWLSLYNDSWVFRRAIDKPARDEITCGITINGDIREKDEILKIYQQRSSDLIELRQWSLLFGGAVGVVMFDNLSDEDYCQPISEKIRLAKAMRIYTTDRWYGCAPEYDNLVNDMGDLDFGKPEYYRITFSDGKSLRVHHSYILRGEGRIAPRYVKSGQLQGWGYAEGAHIINELMRDDKLKSSITSLMDKSLIEVIKMSGMRGIFMGNDPESEAQLRKRLEMVNWGRNFNSLTFLDKDDDYQMNNFSGLSGLSDILEKNMWLISSALEMQGILYGDLKQGFSTDSDALERYDETIQGRCNAYVRPIVHKFLQIIYLWKNITEPVDFNFNSLLQKKQDKDQIESINTYVELLSKLLGDGILTPALYARSVQRYVEKGIVDFGLTDEEINKLDNNLVTEMEGMTL